MSDETRLRKVQLDGMSESIRQLQSENAALKRFAEDAVMDSTIGLDREIDVNLKRARNAALDEAAGVADKAGGCEYYCGENIADDIRALKSVACDEGTSEAK